MNRAEMRRKQREEQKAKTATFCLTRADLDRAVHEVVADKIAEVKRQAAEEAVNTAMVLMLALPMKVLMEYYWPKTYVKRLPEFNERVLALYKQWSDGELDINQLREEIWEYAGIRLEESEE